MTHDEIIKNHPQLFRGRCKYLEVGDGWLDTIAVLSALLESRYNQDVRDAEYLAARIKAGHISNDSDSVRLDKLVEKLANDTMYPVVSQVKEKFGTLRFYVDYCNDEEYGYIQMAENMSGITCEDCGNIGQTENTSGWLVTLCETCINKRKKK